MPQFELAPKLQPDRVACDNRLIDQLQWWLEFVVAMKDQGQADVVLAQWCRAVSR